MIEFNCEITEKQKRLLNDRAKRVMLMRCSEFVLQDRVASVICESQLRELIKKYDLCDVSDFSGLHISVAKMLTKCAISATYKYPRLRAKMNFIGSRQGYMDLLDKLSINDEETVRALGIQYIMDSDTVKSIGSVAKQLLADSMGSDGNTLAQAVSFIGIIDGILVDEADFNNKEFRQIKIELERAVATKQFPQGCSSVEAVIYHEIGHVLDFLCGISKSTAVVNEFNSYTQKQLKDDLSAYAATSVMEYVAEGFAESMSNPLPRAIASNILKHINDFYNSLK